MPDLGPHAVFIWSAYALTFAAIAVLTVSILINDRHQRETLAELERRGIKRRSARAKPTTGKKK
jgi:heme exporter protein D